MFSLAAITLAAALALGGRVGPEPDALQPTAPPQGEPDSRREGGFRALKLRVSGVPFAELRAALALRLPEVPILRHGRTEEAPVEEPYVFADVQAEAGARDRFRLTIITSGLDAYHREVEARDQVARVLASTIANLLFAIEAQSVEPDQVDIAIPPPEDDVEEVEPAAEKPEDEETEPKDEESREGPSATGGATAVPRTARTWEIGPAGGAGVLVGLAPSGLGSALAGWGGGLALDVRSPSGALAGLDLRAAGRGANGHRLTRIRVALGGGYCWRWGSFELPLELAASVEPWFVTREGSATGIERDGADRRPRPLLGLVARLSPGYRITLRRGRLLALRLGPRLELSGSFLVDEAEGATAATVVAVDENGERLVLFRLGGLELGVGIELALWFGASASASADNRRGR